MGIREVGWLIFLVGLPFAHFLFKPLNLWQGQALWAQGWIILLFSLSLGNPGKTLPPNRPLAAFIAWVGLTTLFIWWRTMVDQKTYPILMLQGTTHLLLLVMAYSAAMTTWTVTFVGKLVKALALAGIAVITYCVLQLLNLDQFLNQIDYWKNHDALVGTMGNPSHLATHLSLLFPLLLLCAPLWSLALIGILLVTQSLGGQVATFAVASYWAWHGKKKWFWVVGIVGVVGLIYLATHQDHFNPHGRFKAWSIFYQMFQQRSITGWGVGSVMAFSRTITDSTSPLFQWHHVHQEFFQVAIEHGVIGLGFLWWMLWELVGTIRRLPKTPLVVALSGILLAFGINSLVNFPAHLWVTGSYALVAYCGLKVIEAETGSCRS